MSRILSNAQDCYTTNVNLSTVICFQKITSETNKQKYPLSLERKKILDKVTNTKPNCQVSTATQHFLRFNITS